MSDSPTVEVNTLNRLLRMAVVNGVENAVRIHIDRGDNINARDSNGLTPLMLAAARNQSVVCQILLDAGVDFNLTSPSGQDALAIAKLAGAYDVVSMLEAVSGVEYKSFAESTGLPTFNTSEEVEPHRFQEQDQAPVKIQTNHEQAELDEHSNANLLLSDLHHRPPVVDAIEVISSTFPVENIQFNSNSLGGLDDFIQFDHLNWEAEEERPPPLDDPTLAMAAVAVHVCISNHEPIDSSADWEDFEFDLPTVSAPFLRSEDAEAREKLRLLFLRAVREGSVPSLLVKNLTVKDDGSENDEAEALLIRTINDLGAEIDERFEYTTSFEDFEVFVNPDESRDEDDAVSLGMAQIDATALNRNAPLRMYLKETQRGRLISSVEEIALAKDMETGLESALDALAFWQVGIEHVIASANIVKAGAKPLHWISIKSVEEPPRIGDELETFVEKFSLIVEDVNSRVDDESDVETHSSGDEATDFFESIECLSCLPIGNSLGDGSWTSVRNELASLSLSNGFMVYLLDVAAKDKSEAAALFGRAIQAHQSARARMATANLKLVYSIAKKYLYSSLPIDDLIQEGNLGLLKAIEKYDWRKGYRFSTYATWWIRQKISRAVAETCRTIRVPVHFHAEVQSFQREYASLEKILNREPSTFELARQLRLPTQKIETLLRAMIEPVSIDEVNINGFIATDSIHEYVTPDPFEVIAAKEMGEALDVAVAALGRKNEWIVRMRYGLGLGEAFTLEEIGQRFDVTRERIRQIETKALRKLQHPSRSDALSVWAGNQPVPQKNPSEHPESSEPSEVADLTNDADANCELVQIKTTPQKDGSLKIQSPSRLTVIDRLVLQSVALGIPVEDDRAGLSKRLWVKITDTSEAPTRKLVRKLMNTGFEYLPGKGYYK